MQKNWIGKSTGHQIKFAIKDKNNFKISEIEVFTTRIDTLFGATYLVLAPEHSLVNQLKDYISNRYEVEKYIEETMQKSELERTDLAKTKTGVELKGILAVNPTNKKLIPLWISDYVLSHYGTGAIMAVPAHDERDFDSLKNLN
jgi:leucyl-tRNA synthetase